jgi:hypothetical protein
MVTVAHSLGISNHPYGQQTGRPPTGGLSLLDILVLGLPRQTLSFGVLAPTLPKLFLV